MKEQDAAHSFEADFHVTKEQFKAIKEADVIRLTDGQEYVKKEVAVGIMKSYTEDLRAELTRLRSELQQLKAWKESELKLWGPILEYMRTHPDRRLGERIPDRVLEFLKEHSRLKSEQQQERARVAELKKEIERLTPIEFSNHNTDG